MAKKVTEQELLEAVARLKEKTVISESTISELTAQDVGQGVGNVLGGAAGIATAVPRAGMEIGQAVANKAGDWWNQAKQGVQNFAGGVAQGAKQGWAATDPANLVGGGSQSAKPAKWPTTPQEITAFQQAHGLKADGLIGAKTQAALAQAGLKPPAGFQAVGAKKPAAAPAAPAAATAPQVPGTQGTAPGVAPAVAQAASGQGSNATADTTGGGITTAQGQGQKPIPGNTDPTKGPIDYSLTGTAPQQGGLKIGESVNFENDELNRLVSLVQYK